MMVFGGKQIKKKHQTAFMVRFGQGISPGLAGAGLFASVNRLVVLKFKPSQPTLTLAVV
jgi:hypothetical protein